MSNWAIDIQRLSKHYPLDKGGELLRALDEVTLQLLRGEILGIIGSNGAGKSTLLKILSRITYPTAGRAVVQGKLASLLEVGTGFHPELSGLENIYLNGSILGMRRRAIKQRLDAIVAFAGTERFLNTPLKHYSSGMYVRLAFAVAAHLESDILLIDEVLAVGDADFQKKCIAKIEETTREDGRSVIFVSHNINVARNLCDSMAQLSAGRVVEHGEVDRVSENYLLHMQKQAQQRPLHERTDRSGNGHGRLSKLEISGEGQTAANRLQTGKKARFHLGITLNNQARQDVQVHLALYNHNGSYLSTLSNGMCGYALTAESHTQSLELSCEVPRWPLMAGRYYCSAQLFLDGIKADQVQFAQPFETTLGDYYGAGSFFEKRNPGVFLEQEWRQLEQ